MMRMGYIILGWLMVGLGFIGAFLPVMPTKIFLILAAWFFARSSPRLEAWLLSHPRFGSTLRDWQEHGTMPRKAKLMACGGMSIGYALFLIGAQPGLLLAVAVAVFMIGSAAYIISRPVSKPDAAPAEWASRNPPERRQARCD
ncbi:YbaN family protein [Aquamicrobium segne]|uniref:YbaN family protein n=1 Tax=Aquamicrobium segne TaxID=469547 RepID=A0ABW0H1H6_9HYPH